MKRTMLACTAAVSALVLLAACGGNDDDAGAAGATPSVGTTFNDADVEFAQMMIVHHRQAVEMADLAGTRAADAEIKQLATRIKAAQDPEIVTMTGWLTTWGEPTAAPGGGHSMPGMSSMPGEMSKEDMAKLESAKGTKFDRMFAEMMVDHHNGAIEMARDERATGGNPAAKALAATIEKAQTAEVGTLKQILDRL
jgi:uncharacterized protein (DUF305 family)